MHDQATNLRACRRPQTLHEFAGAGAFSTDYNPEGISIPAQREAGKHKAESVGADIVEEFIEPGKTATNIDKRPAFQEMVAWVRAQKDIDYVIVHHFNRVFRNAVGDIEHQRQRLAERLSETNDELSESARLIELSLRLLENPQELYRHCDDEQRRLLNQALFEGLYVDHDQVAGHDLREPFGLLHQAQRGWHADKPDPGAGAARAHEDRRAVPDDGNGSSATQGVEALLAGMDLVRCSSKPSGVGLTLQHTNQTILVEGPEITIRPVGTRRVTAGGSR